MLGHGVGWPVAAGGSRAITDALASLLACSAAGSSTGRRSRRWRSLSRRGRSCWTPRRVTCSRSRRPDLPRRYRRVLAALPLRPGGVQGRLRAVAPVPWSAAACRSAGTVHVGGTLAEIAEAEAEVAAGRHPRRPFVLVAQQSLFDPTRGRRGCHTPVGVLPRPQRIGHRHDRRDRAADRAIRARVRRDGDRRAVRSGRRRPRRRIRTTLAAISTAERPISASCWRGRWCAGRTRRRDPRLFLCSSSAPPGGGLHGMCGWHAARAALRGAASLSGIAETVRVRAMNAHWSLLSCALVCVRRLV